MKNSLEKWMIRKHVKLKALPHAYNKNNKNNNNKNIITQTYLDQLIKVRRQQKR